MAVGKALMSLAKGAGKAATAPIKGLKAVGKKMGVEKLSDDAKVELQGKVTESLSGLNQTDTPGGEISPMLQKMMQPIDRGFYGHMDGKSMRKAFKSPTIMGGQNCASKKRK